MLRVLFSALSFASCALSINAQQQPQVQTDCGAVQGFVDSSSHIVKFLGIPYAAPPTGQRRWQLPTGLKAASACWNGTLQTTSFGNMCVQPSLDGTQLLGDENCLFLNVFTPLSARSTSTPLPVFVFIHGGSLLRGSGGDAYLDPSNFVADMNFVAVTLNYRLSGFGFLALREFTARSSTQSSGNYGYADQIQALKWVQANIRAFGGDPNRVTLSGQSSGATSVLALLVSPLAKGLFHNAISMSASYVFDRTLEEATADNRIFVENAGCENASSDEVYNCLMALTPAQIFVASPLVEFPSWAALQSLQFPVPNDRSGAMSIVDGYVIPYEPQFAFKHGLANPVNTVWGSAAQEEDWFALLDYSNLNMSQFIQTVIAPTFSTFSPSLPSEIESVYASLFQPSHSAQFAYVTMLADIGVTCGQNDLAKQQKIGFSLSPSTSSLHVYRYYLTATPSSPLSIFGGTATYSFHALDLIALLDTAGTAFQHFNDTKLQRLEQKLRLAFGQLITQNAISAAGWEEVTALPTKLQTVVISNSNVSSHNNYRANVCDLWWGNYDLQAYGWVN